MSTKSKRILFFVFYFLLIFSPIILLLTLPRPEGRTFPRDLSVSLAFIGFAMMGLQFVPTARLPFLGATLDLDRLYTLHHYFSVLSFSLILSHPLILFVSNPKTLILLNYFKAPETARWGLLGILGLLIIVISSVLRQQLKIDYDGWRIAHDFLAISIAVTGMVHMFKVNYYMAMPSQRILWIVLISIWSTMTLYTRVLRPIRQLNRPFSVQEVRQETPDTWTLSLVPVNHDCTQFRAGQVAWMTIKKSPFSFQRNPFSISSSALRENYLEFTIKETGDFTNQIKDLETGKKVYLEGPFGIFRHDDPKIKELVLIAGGIGSAPIMSILRTMADDNDQRPVIFIYGSKNEENIIYYKELKELTNKLKLKIVHILEEPDPEWTGYQGLITYEILDKELPVNREEATYFICGPLAMIALVEKLLGKFDVPAKRINSEKYEMA
jgi:predicted ferric reductase